MRCHPLLSAAECGARNVAVASQTHHRGCGVGPVKHQLSIPSIKSFHHAGSFFVKGACNCTNKHHCNEHACQFRMFHCLVCLDCLVCLGCLVVWLFGWAYNITTFNCA